MSLLMLIFSNGNTKKTIIDKCGGGPIVDRQRDSAIQL